MNGLGFPTVVRDWSPSVTEELLLSIIIMTCDLPGFAFMQRWWAEGKEMKNNVFIEFFC